MNENVDLVSDFYKRDSFSLVELLHCEDLFNEIKLENQFLIQHLTGSVRYKEIVSFFHKANDPFLLRRIISLFTINNSFLLPCVVESVELLDYLVSILEIPQKYHNYVVGSVTNILSTALDFFPNEFAQVAHQSPILYCYLIENLHYSSVFQFCGLYVSKSVDVQPFIWCLFKSLMDGHGIVSHVSIQNESNSYPKKIPPIIRKSCIDLMVIYFCQVGNYPDIYTSVSESLPLLLLDSSDDTERSLVFKLGLLMNPNTVLAMSALSILNCLKSEDILIQYAIHYLKEFNVIVPDPALELFLYRIMKRTPNNFVLKATCKLLMNIIDINGKDSSIIQSIFIIVEDYLDKLYTLPQIIKAYSYCLLNIAQGCVSDLESEAFSGFINNYSVSSISKENRDQLLFKLQESSKTIEDDNTICVPQFSLHSLCPDQINVLTGHYQNINKLPHLVSNNEAVIPLTKLMGVETPLFAPHTEHYRQSSIKETHRLNENDDDYEYYSYSDEYSDEEIVPMVTKTVVEDLFVIKTSNKIAEVPIAGTPIQIKEPSIINDLSNEDYRTKKPEIKTKIQKTISPKKHDDTKVKNTSPAKSKENNSKKTTTKKTTKTKTTKKIIQKKSVSERNLSLNIDTYSISPSAVRIDDVIVLPPRNKIELDLSIVRLMPRRPQITLNNRVLVIESQMKSTQKTCVSQSVCFEIPIQVITKASFRELLMKDDSDIEDDENIEPLESENDFGDDRITNSLSAPLVHSDYEEDDE